MCLNNILLLLRPFAFVTVMKSSLITSSVVERMINMYWAYVVITIEIIGSAACLNASTKYAIGPLDAALKERLFDMGNKPKCTPNTQSMIIATQK